MSVNDPGLFGLLRIARMVEEIARTEGAKCGSARERQKYVKKLIARGVIDVQERGDKYVIGFNLERVKRKEAA